MESPESPNPCRSFDRKLWTKASTSIRNRLDEHGAVPPEVVQAAAELYAHSVTLSNYVRNTTGALRITISHACKVALGLKERPNDQATHRWMTEFTKRLLALPRLEAEKRAQTQRFVELIGSIDPDHLVSTMQDDKKTVVQRASTRLVHAGHARS